MSQKKLDSALQALRAESSEKPPAAVELVLRTEFRKLYGKRRARRSLLWKGAGLLAATAVAAVLFLVSAPKHPQQAVTHQKPAPPQAPALVKSVPAERPVTTATVRTHVPRRKRPARATDRGTEFVSIPYTDSFAAAQRLDVYRVQMPRAMVAQFGLPLSAGGFDSMATADVVVGNDGVARAIRFVH